MSNTHVGDVINEFLYDPKSQSGAHSAPSSTQTLSSRHAPVFNSKLVFILSYAQTSHLIIQVTRQTCMNAIHFGFRLMFLGTLMLNILPSCAEQFLLEGRLGKSFFHYSPNYLFDCINWSLLQNSERHLCDVLH